MKSRKTRWIRTALGAALLAALLIGGLSLEEPRKGGGVTLSRASGFYDAPFDLELSGTGGRIYYTLDCTEPDESAIPYDGPIHIADASENDNVYSMNTDVSLDFNREVVVNAGSDVEYGYVVPTEKVDKATVVRAVLIDEFGNRSRVETGVYFVGFDEKTGYEGMNVISVTTDPQNLFDYETGIYVTGKTFDDSLVDGFVVTPVNPNFGTWPANYRMRGQLWEREAQVVCFNAARETTLSGSYGLRIQGGASRGMLPKSLNLFARKRYGASDIPALSLFDRDWRLKSLNLNSGAQGMDSKLHDYLVNTLAANLNVLTREYEPYQLFLDGEYWGVYWMTPRFKGDYLQEKYGVPTSDVIVRKTGGIEVGTSEDDKYYKELLEFAAEHDLSDPEMYARIGELVDLESCVDYYALEMYIVNTDWPDHNASQWRTRGKGTGPYSDGRWRWIVYDVNIAMDPHRASQSFVEWTEEADMLFASLMENEAFADAIRSKLVELAENNFNPARVNAFITDYEYFMADAMEKEYRRFYGDKRTQQDFFKACEDIRTFFELRYQYIRATYGDANE